MVLFASFKTTKVQAQAVDIGDISELNRYGKETGKATGSMNKPKGSPVKKGGSGDTALNFVRNKIRK